MRGSPPLHLLCFAVIFALMTAPLIRLTASRMPLVGPTESEMASATEVSTLIRVRTAHAPAALSLSLAGKELIPSSVRDPQSRLLEFRLPLPKPKASLELLLKAEWPPTTNDTAITVEVEPDGSDVKSQTRWSDGGKVNDVLSFDW